MSSTPKPVRRTRVIGALMSAYCLGAVVFLIAMRPSGPPPWIERDSPPETMAAAANDAIASHPLGGLLVPYEHRRLERFVRATLDGQRDRARYIDSALFVFYIVLDEMTWLLVALLALGLIGGLLVLRAGPLSSLVGGIVLLLAVPGPLVSVGPGSVVLTLPLLLGGILALVLRPRFEPPVAPAAAGVAGGPGVASQIAGPAVTHPGREVAIGLGLIALGIGSAALAANMGSSGAAKVWIGAAAAFGLGIWLLVTGLIGLGKGPP